MITEAKDEAGRIKLYVYKLSLMELKWYYAMYMPPIRQIQVL